MPKTRTKTKITIPSVEELEDRLAGIDRLLTAKRWERAAIVWAFTTNEGPGKRPQMPEKGHFPVPMDTFAGLGFAGLGKRDTVARYRNAWQEAIDQGKAKEVHPGDDVELPDLPWPPDTNHHRYNQPDKDVLIQQATEDSVGVTKVLDIAENTAAMQSAIKASPEVRKAAVEAIRQDPATMQAVIAEHPEAMRAAIMESPDVASAAFHAVQDAAEQAFAGKEPPPNPDSEELQRLWDLRNLLRRTNSSVTEAARLLLDVPLAGEEDQVHRGIAHLVDMIKDKVDLMHAHVHEGAEFDAALQTMLDSEK